MTGDELSEPLMIGIRVDDAALAERLCGLFPQTPGLRIARPDEPCDLVVGEPPLIDEQREPLTPRERDVLALLTEGLSNRAIAERLGIALDTAKFHVGRIIDKLDATGRTDAVAHAVRRGVIHL